MADHAVHQRRRFGLGHQVQHPAVMGLRLSGAGQQHGAKSQV
ncbi:hypothetical protein [Pseudomonas sp. P7779]